MQIKLCFLVILVGLVFQVSYADSVTIDGQELSFDKPENQLSNEKQKFFYQQYLKAAAAGTAEALKEVIHSGSYTCQTSDLDKEGFQYFIRKDIARKIPDNAKVRWFPWKKEFATTFGMDGLAAFPSTPEAILGISFSEKIKDQKGQVIKVTGDTIMRAVVRADDGQYKIAIPCLTEKGRQVFAKKKKSAGS